ncbi:hypothetical protein DU500_12790 [Haloplanus rubicundus]|uniref:Uncharacterized protein n=1 Tax=Haloplanus rubicundus TaxID=1547898 RepID=A0A345E4V5_9EURY|nr:hypothetical protein DU500_12790 [Haloplanus rubicundus]
MYSALRFKFVELSVCPCLCYWEFLGNFGSFEHSLITFSDHVQNPLLGKRLIVLFSFTLKSVE